MAQVRHIQGTVVSPASLTWECASAPPGSVERPSDLAAASLRWFPAEVPGTMASALSRAGAWTPNDARDFDDDDWWLRCTIGGPERTGRGVLGLGGLATLADVWLDDERVLRGGSMFVEHRVAVPRTAGADRRLVIRFAALSHALAQRRPRPRWRATTVTSQQLRWARTALLGRMPAFRPTPAHVGAFRPVTWSTETRARVEADVVTRVEGRDGLVDACLRVECLDGAEVLAVSITVGRETADLALSRSPTESGAAVARGRLRISDIELWWPFTHGPPTLHDVSATIATSRGAVAVDLGRTGFRTVSVDRSDGGFGLRVNGVDVFCRGACWFPLNSLSLWAEPGAYRDALGQVCAAGMNMVRVSGVTAYETQGFHDLCDELGVMVWQDFMFANMDYPGDDPSLRESIRVEATQLLDRLQLSPSLVVLCGNSEVSQQSAMLGRPLGDPPSAIFAELLPGVSQTVRPDVPYIDGSPTGGTPAFRVDAGVSHYYGVGAYRRPLEDARRARVRFTSECLALSNVPCDETVDAVLAGGGSPPTDPRWKASIPRDRGASWDFEDVRDHYLREVFGIDALELRSADLRRYLELGRLVSGEVMAATMSEWRRTRSECKGALVWTLRDLFPGAGWGLVDADGRPKAPYFFLRRVLQPVAVLLTDEGVNGLMLHVVNDRPTALSARLRLVVYRAGEVPLGEGELDITVAGHTSASFADAELLGRFVDATYAYRFGPREHDLCVATLVDHERQLTVGRAFYRPPEPRLPTEGDPGLEAVGEAIGPSALRVTIRTTRYARAVAFDAPGLVPDDDFFDIEPGGERAVTLSGTMKSSSIRVKAVNAALHVRVNLDPKAGPST